MQTILLQLPEVGKIYTSQLEPGFSLYVEKVMHIPQDEFGEAGFIVEGCDPKNKDNKVAPGYEFAGDEWEMYRFVQVPA